jgi:hypothetical protein
VSLHPEVLQILVIFWFKIEGFQYPVELFKIASRKRHHRFALENAFVSLESIALWEGPEKARQSFHLTRLLQDFTHARDLLLSEPKGFLGRPQRSGGPSSAGVSRPDTIIILIRILIILIHSNVSSPWITKLTTGNSTIVRCCCCWD